MLTLMPSKPSEPAKSIVVKVSCVSNESTPTNFYMWSRVMMSNGQKRNASSSHTCSLPKALVLGAGLASVPPLEQEDMRRTLPSVW